MFKEKLITNAAVKKSDLIQDEEKIQRKTDLKNDKK